MELCSILCAILYGREFGGKWIHAYVRLSSFTQHSHTLSLIIGWTKRSEFQSITRRDKKAFFSGQCKEIEENNRMGKTRDLFKKIRDA